MTYKLINGLVIPAANEAPQILGGDTSGTTSSATVAKLQGRTISNATPGASQILTWINANSNWSPSTAAAFPSNSVSATTDGYEINTTGNTGTLTKIIALKNPGNNLTNGYNQNNFAWANSSATLNTARLSGGCCGVIPAALVVGGLTVNDNSSFISSSEKFNGNSWSTSGSIATARGNAACSGTQNAANYFAGQTGGGTSNRTEVFNGSSWTVLSGNLNTSRNAVGGCGTAYAALAVGGNTGSNSVVVEKFNSCAWATTTSISTATEAIGVTGIQNLALAFGGFTTVFVATAQLFNGSTWTATGNLITGREDPATAGAQTSALAFGGTITGPTVTATTEFYFNNHWVGGGSLNTGRDDAFGCGTAGYALVTGGKTATPTTLSSTEIYTGAYESFRTTTYIDIYENNTLNTSKDIEFTQSSDDSVYLIFTQPFSLAISTTYNQEDNQFDYLQSDGVWTAGGSIATAVFGPASAGTAQAAIAMGGELQAGSAVNTSQTYNGTSWTLTNNLTYSTIVASGGGYKNSAIVAGGETAAGVTIATTNKFDGTNWTTTGSLNQARVGAGGCGSQSAFIMFGGLSQNNVGSGTGISSVETFNGTTWATASGSLTAIKCFVGGAGTQNGALCSGGRITNGSGAHQSAVEKYNGSVWSVVGGLAYTVSLHGSNGSTNSAFAYGGDGTNQTAASRWNGNYWTTITPLGTARYNLGTQSGTSQTALAIAGGQATALATTEAYVVNNSNLIPSGIERFRVIY